MLRYAPRARADLRELARRITEDNGSVVADSVIRRIAAGILNLERFPELGRSGRFPNTRELCIAGLPFLAVYRLDDKGVLILRVLHCAMNWPPLT